MRTPAPHLGDVRPELASFSELDAVLQRCLAKRPEARPASAEELLRLLEAVEPTLGRAAGADLARAAINPAGSEASAPTPGGALRAMTASPSSFTTALPADGELPAGPGDRATAEPPTRDVGARATTGPLTSGELASLGARRGRMWLGVAGLVVAGVVAVGSWIGLRGRGEQRAPGAASRADSASVTSSGSGPGSSPGSGQPAASGSGSSPGQGSSAGPGSSSGSGPGAGSAVATTFRRALGNPEVARHLAAAEEARHAGKALRQIAEADAALKADPRNTRARFLLADGLILAGDLDNGCKYLRELGRNPLATARGHQAGCPTN